MKRSASAVWNGSGKEGTGSLTTESGTLSATPYSFKKRFGDEKGTNPEELIAVAHAGCFSMALAFALSGAGHEPRSIETKADLSMEQQGGGFAITAVHLTTKVSAPGLDEAKFQEIAKGAKENCPVSKVLNATITMDATLA